ncbi:hypothetical protein H4R35_006416, partial [Dimargaris xerosporica]
MAFAWPTFDADIVGSYVALAHHPYAAQRDDEISLTAGDLVCLWDRRFTNWWAGANLTTGKTGYFPAQYVKIIGRPANQASLNYDDHGPATLPPVQFMNLKRLNFTLKRALYDYEAQDANELTLRAGDPIVVLAERAGWCMGFANRRTGYFPIKYAFKLNFSNLQRLPETTTATTTAASSPKLSTCESTMSPASPAVSSSASTLSNRTAPISSSAQSKLSPTNEGLAIPASQ